MRTFMFVGNAFNFYPYTAPAGHEDEAERSPNGHGGNGCEFRKIVLFQIRVKILVII